MAGASRHLRGKEVFGANLATIVELGDFLRSENGFEFGCRFAAAFPGFAFDRAGDLLLAFGGELVALRQASPIFECDGYPVLHDSRQPHADPDPVERIQLAEVFATAPRRHHCQTIAQLIEDRWRVFAQEHLANLPLPAQMVHKVHIACQVGLLKPNDVIVFVSPHVV